MNIKDRFITVGRTARVPPRLLIVLANPRSGSTWLFDALRCHPCVYVESRGTVYKYFGLLGRRYPADLSGRKNGGVKIEVRQGRWAAIPAFEIGELRPLVSARIVEKRYAVEKIHPHFFDFNVKEFVKCLGEMEKRATVKVCYLVRDPKQSIVSFLEYKKRNPSWNRQRAIQDVPKHMRQIYESIYRTASAWPGPVVEYGDLKRSFDTTIGNLFEFLWPGEKTDGRLINRIYDMTARKRWITGGNRFIAKRESSDEEVLGGYRSLLRAYEDEISQCYQEYEAVLQLGQSSRGSLE
jgi:hypothetical protein